MLTELFLRQAGLAARLTGEAVPEALLAAFAERAAPSVPQRSAQNTPEEQTAQLEQMVTRAAESIRITSKLLRETTERSVREQNVWNVPAEYGVPANGAEAIRTPAPTAHDMAAISRFFERDARRYG